MNERRRDRRFTRNDLSLTLTDGVKAQSVNISTRGLYCMTDRPLPEFSKLKVCLELPFSDGDRYRIECEGVVVRSEPQSRAPNTAYSVAIYFLNLDSERAAVIEDFLGVAEHIA